MTAAAQQQPDDDLDAPNPGAAIAVARPHRGSITEKIQYAQHLAQSGLLPAHYRKEPANVLYAVEYGDMPGLAPMAAITGVHVIEGKPTASSALMSALVRRAGHRLRVKGDDRKATVQIIRSDDPDWVFESVWDMKRAEQAGLTGKKVWKQYPAAMLKARAISECARDACEEALLGLHYTAEEMGAEVDEDGNVIKATAERIDQPASNVRHITGEPDWDTETQAAERAEDRERLSELWHLAKALQPLNKELREGIGAAGLRVKAIHDARADAAAVAAAADEPIDAELVDDPQPTTPADPARLAADLVDNLLLASNPDQVAAILDGPLLRTVATVDVSGLLTDDDREVLALDPDSALPLSALAGRVHEYTERHQRSPRNPLDV